jgi:hypothetical protein
MQTHTTEKEGLLTEGADYSKKEGGLRVLTRTGVTKVAEMLRQRRQQAQQPPLEPDNAAIAEPEKKEEWRPGEGIGTAPAPTMATALRSRNLPNRKRLSCTINGQEHAVLVRVTGDCPLIDPGLVDQTIRKFKDGDFDYLTLDVLEATFLRCLLPKGGVSRGLSMTQRMQLLLETRALMSLLALLKMQWAL